MAKSTYTVCEDQPQSSRWDVEVRTFDSWEAAERYVTRTYTVDERNGDSTMCKPMIREDRTGEYC